MARTIEPLKNGYVAQASGLPADSSNKQPLEEKPLEEQFKTFRTAIDKMAFAIFEARGNDRLEEMSLSKDIRPDLWYIIAKLGELMKQPEPPEISSGILTIEKTRWHLNQALSHLNTAVRQYNHETLSHSYEHWFGYQESARQCAEELEKASELLVFPQSKEELKKASAQLEFGPKSKTGP